MTSRFTLCVLLLLFLSSCSVEQAAPANIVRISGATMGTSYHISWVDNGLPADPLQQQIDSRLVEINRSMSTYDPNSEISNINQSSSAGSVFQVSADLKDVLLKSKWLYGASEGLFDISIGPLVNAWGFGPTPDQRAELSGEQILELTEAIGSGNFNISNTGSLSFEKPLSLDLSAIAKGWAVDQIALLLESKDIQSYLVEIGGELRTKGLKPGEEPWRIAIERPTHHILEEQTVQLILAPGDMGVATSGDYRNYFERDGKRYSHTINPFSGRPVDHSLASVTVIHPECGMADAWATALNVAGPEKGMELAEQHQLAVFMIVRTNETFVEITSSKFQALFPNALSQGSNKTGESE